MSDLIEPLQWDTEFFGFPIGRVELAGTTETELAAIDELARTDEIRCLYGSLDPIDTAATVAVQRAGYRFVEAGTLFRLDESEPPIPRPDGVVVRQGTPDDLGELTEMIDSLVPWSRFGADPRFGPEAARRLQHATIERAARCDTGERQLMVAEEGSQILAFITRCTAPDPVVDTVGTMRRGSGAARYLIEDAREWARPGPLLGGPIAARNVHALRYVSHCGYRVERVRYLYHRWLDEAPGA